jgi:Kef-type K+ transport system membrane component KefB
LPKLAERIALPGVVGLLAGGVVLGPGVLGLLVRRAVRSRCSPSWASFCSCSSRDTKSTGSVQAGRWKAAGYGLLTFAVPLALGTAVGLVFGYRANAAILIGSLLASHTLLSLPAVKELGLLRLDSVVVTVGAT